MKSLTNLASAVFGTFVLGCDIVWITVSNDPVLVCLLAIALAITTTTNYAVFLFNNRED